MKIKCAVSFLAVVLIYAAGVMCQVDMILPLWCFLAACGIVFYLSDGMVIRSANPKNYSFLDINKSELDYAESTRRKAGQDCSAVTTLMVSGALAAMLCLVHCYFF